MEQKKSKSTVKVVSYMMIITLIGKVLGLFRDILMANYYGMGMEANAFNAASLIPRTFFDAVFASAISASFIPIFNEYLEKKGVKDAFRFSNSFITLIGLFTAALTLGGMMFVEPLTTLFVDGYDAQTSALCAQLLRVLFPTVFFTGIAYSLVGILQSMDEFGIPAAMSIVSNGIIICYYLFFNDRFGIFGLAAAFLLGWAMQAAIQIPPLRKKGYHYRPSLRFYDGSLKKVGALMLPVMVSTWVQPINIAVNTKYGSRLFDGAGSSAINYANNLYSIIVGVFVLSVANVIFPKLSRLSANDNKEEFGRTMNQTVKTLSFLLIPMTIGLMALSEPLVRLFYERNEFTAFSTMITSRALFFFSLGMFGFGVQTILSRGFYAVQDGRTPMISGGVSIIANILLCQVLWEPLNVAGLALASAASQTISAALLVIPMEKRGGGFFTKPFLIGLLKMLCAALVMGIVVVWLRDLLIVRLADSIITRVLVLAVPACIGVLIYMGISRVLVVEEATIVFDTIKKFTRREK